MKEGRKPECPEKPPDEYLQKMPHTKARKFNSQPRLEPALQHWWQARNANHYTTCRPKAYRFTGKKKKSVDSKIRGRIKMKLKRKPELSCLMFSPVTDTVVVGWLLA